MKGKNANFMLWNGVRYIVLNGKEFFFKNSLFYKIIWKDGNLHS